MRVKTKELKTPYYALKDTLTFLTDGERTPADREYSITVRDLPNQDRPREKLLAHGPAFLSMSELLAVLFGTGTKKEEVLAMTQRIIQEYGKESILRQKDAAKLSDDLSIPIGKAMQIVAAGELGRRVFDHHENGARMLRTAHDVFDYVADMRALPKEHLRGIYLNAHYKVVRDEIISIGTVDASIIHPREVFKPALECSAAAVIIVHNHPSGITEPSAADIAVTKRLIEAGKLIGIDLIDHIIVTKDAFESVILK